MTLLKGSNLAGGDVYYNNPSNPMDPAVGPILGTHYQFMSNKELDRLIATGMTAFRLLFAWECVQPKPWQDLNALAGNYKTYFDNYKDRVAYLTGKGCTVCIDIHGGADPTFGAWRGTKIGTKLPTGEAVTDMFVDLYWRMGQIFGNNPKVIWGLTNEPLCTAAAWYDCAQKAINKLRSVGANQLIACPGIGYTGAASWAQQNGPYWNLTDPANNLAIQVHLYMASNGGAGDEYEIMNEDIGVTRLKNAVDWCRSKGVKCLVGEVGMESANPLAKATWGKLDSYMEANSDILLGWLWWCAGPDAWWANGTFSICNSTKGNNNLALISPSLKRTGGTTVDIAALQKQLADAQTQLKAAQQDAASAHKLIDQIKALVGT